MPSQPAPDSTGGSPRIPVASAEAVRRVVDFFKTNGKLRSVTGAAVSSPLLPRGAATPPLAGMPSQPPQGSTGGSPRISAPFQPAPDYTGGSHRTPAPGSIGVVPRIPELSAQAVDRIARKCIILVDWWLERVEGEEGKIRVAGTTFTPRMAEQMRKGASSSNMRMAVRVFRSSAIVKRHDYTSIESEDGYQIEIGHCLNIPKTRENGFSEEVCESFDFGFPDLWQRLVNPKMVPDDEHALSPSETTTGPPSPSVEDYMAKFLSDSFSSKIGFDFTENDFDSGSISSDSKVDGNILAPSKISSVVNEGYRSTVGCGQAKKDANIQQENMPSCSSEHAMVTPKFGKDSVNLGTTDALELPTEGMTPKFGAIRGSEDSIGRRLRSGKVLPIGGPMKKQKKIQQQMVNQGATPAADLTSHENGPAQKQPFLCARRPKPPSDTRTPVTCAASRDSATPLAGRQRRVAAPATWI
ncbi:hypothetical protein SORBI_3002G173400 [Sorghum bicolor]|uniref:SANTA domain-containing protein n=1 Tax=Sorghum bicolor TaxID=4558 RepID=A0A1W0W4J4_SORBI|nr:hypothetical protein SORBI_3002G173400 [Sorghum bicolor]